MFDKVCGCVCVCAGVWVAFRVGFCGWDWDVGVVGVGRVLWDGDGGAMDGWTAAVPPSPPRGA